MNQTFAKCSNLEYLDIRNFDNHSLLNKKPFLFSELKEKGKIIYNSENFGLISQEEVGEEWTLEDVSRK